MGKTKLSGGRANGQYQSIKGLSESILHGEGLPQQQLLDNLEAAIYMCDAHGFITQYNKAAVDLWGRKPEIGKDLWCGSWKIYEPDGITPLSLDECPMALTLKKGKSVNGQEIIIEKPNGERAHVLPYPRAFFDDEGEVVGAVNLLLDISSFKMSEQKEAHLAAIVQSSDDAIISKTLDGIITSWNPAAEKIFGYSTEEMIGQHVFRLIPHDRWNEEYTIQDQLRKGNKIDHYVTKRLTKGHRLLDISLTISPIMDGNGNIMGASKIARDITRQKQEEDALSESQERTRLAIQTARLGTWAYDPLSREISLSSECRSVYGLPEKEYLDYNGMINLVHPDDVGLVEDRFSKAHDPSNHGDYDGEYRILTYGNKTTRWIRVKGKMYFSENGRPEKLIGTLLDITDEKRTKEELERTVKERTLDLQKLNEQLRRSNHDLEQFAYIASHDLQEPLRKIQSFIDIISQSDDLAVRKTYFGKIGISAKRMSNLIKDVLNYSRIDKNEMLFDEVNLNEALNDARTDFESLIKEKRAVIKSSELPVLNGIYAQIRQLFANLISNSLKFSSDNPEISITAFPLSKSETALYSSFETGRKYIRLVYRDNGIGFEQKYAEKIFMIFQRLHNRTQYPGTGIGLALCKKIVENHHGLIAAESEPDHGTVFTIILPV